MGDISKNFNRAEFACKDGCGYDDPDPRLVGMCQTIREAVGAPVRINSACRCAKHNAAVGGVKDSYHTKGKAADLSINGSASRLYLIIKILWKEGRLPDLAYCKRYVNKNFVHIDCGGKRNNIFAEGN
ncbi:hypothetical protein FACS1894204_05710 [Synergistales bacterium]|nr:hypothetical protein FACS1894204_05710 [Synergistales bacterium]